MSETQLTGIKRRSRFDPVETEPEQKKTSLDVSAAAARAAELSKELSSKIAMVSSLLTANAANTLKSTTEKKTAFRPLLLDSQGREIDEYGNVVKNNTLQLKTIAANVAVERANKKKENPYLAHRSTTSNSSTIISQVLDGVQVSEGNDPQSALSVVDERLHIPKRDMRGRKGLHFIEAGRLVEEAERIKLKEERKIIAGYSSGRKALQQAHSGDQENTEKNIQTSVNQGAHVPSAGRTQEVPAYPDSSGPALEWWDEAFLPKERRDARKLTKAAHLQSEEDVGLLALHHARTYKLVQHPVPVRPLGVSALGDRPAVVLPMYLTKQERKKLRRTTRQERELEKRDKMMMGLIPAPEPKFKLSNFMKVLGDQAVADPSLVEARVLQQMQKRVLNHEMRNQAAKLTPQERREKKQRKRQEDTSRGAHVAVFRVRDFSNLKHRFKVDVNAQQYFLSGTVLLCAEGGRNLVVAEGGPKGIRKFVRLMTERINWTEPWVPTVPRWQQQQQEEDGVWEVDTREGMEGVDGADADSGDDSSDDEAAAAGRQESSGTERKIDGGEQQEVAKSFANNRCDLLWQGLLPKRSFTGFKFQESQTEAAARKMMRAKGLGHYWDMVEGADAMLTAAAPVALSLF